MKKLIILIFALIVSVSQLRAEIVNNIIINGNDRVSKDTIILLGGIESNKNYDDDVLNDILNNLYETNFFSDIRLEIISNTLNVNVVENKIIQTLQINGIKAKKTVNLIKEVLNLKSKTPFNEYLALKDLNIIKTSLKSVGYYFVEVESSIQENNNNTINLIYDINLGEKALIDKIIFLGNNNFKDNKIRKIIVTEEARFWKFISTKKYMNPERLELDKRLIKNFYLNKGFYNVKVNETFAQFTDKNNFTLTYNIDEGEKFFVNDVSLILPLDYDRVNFTKVISALEKMRNKKYSLVKLNKILTELDKITLNKQYEFITASLNEEIVGDNKLNVSLIVDETEKSYIERIDVVGNDVTIESVIRNNFVVDEGDAYNEILIAKSINNLKARNIFKKVESEVYDGSSEGLKIVKVKVEEKPTGEISLGAGVGSEGGSIGFAVSENNYMGKGLKLKTSFRLTEERVTGLFSITNPNYNYSDNALTTSIKSVVTDRMANYGYKSKNTGFSLGSVFQQYDDFYIAPTFHVGYETLETNQTASASLKKQEGSYFDTSISYKLDYDKRNQSFQTTDGFKSTFIQDLPLLSEDYSLMNGYDFSFYEQFSSDVVGSFLFYGRAVNSITGEDVRISNRLYLPSNRLRGFEQGKIGPKDGGDYIGGNFATAANFVATLPKVFASFQDAEFQFFVDAANVWAVDYNSALDSSKLRTSTGIAVNWYTLIGPLNFSLAQPITSASSDKKESFRFNLGTTF